MDLTEAIEKRRSIRKFDTKKIDNEIIKKILYNGTLAPSGKNRQPWRLVVIQENENLKNKISDIMLEKAEEKIKKGENIGSIKNTAKIMKEAPVFIVVFNCLNNKIVNLQSRCIFLT